MKKPAITPLGYALLGLVHMEPRTGYALRKIFETTPMGHYSSSPGAIYPALKRLETRGLANSRIDNTNKLRPKQIYSATGLGVDMLREWASQPVSKDDVVERGDELMLRFSFMGTLVDSETSHQFLSQMARGIELYIEELEQFLPMMPKEAPPHGRLALISGLESYKAQARWARKAMKEFTPLSK